MLTLAKSETNHASSAPNISSSAVTAAKQNFNASILASLNVFSEMPVHPARVAEISYLHPEIGGAVGIEHVGDQLIGITRPPIRCRVRYTATGEVS